MYEQFRNDFMKELAESKIEGVEQILACLDKASTHYEISKKSEELAVYQDELPDMVKMYLVVKKMEGLSPQTLAGYKMMLEIFFNQIRKEPAAVTPNDIRMFLFWYQSEHEISMRTLDKYREYIARFFAWANNEGYIDRNPSKGIPGMKYETKPREALSQMELERMRWACGNSRDRAILEVLYSTGCRVSELVNLKKTDVNWADKSVHLFGKGKKHRTSYLNAKAEFVLQEYLNTRQDDSESLFVSKIKPFASIKKEAVEKIVRQISSKAFGDTKKVTPHILRHTTATVALERGMPITDISRLLGHSQVSTTMIYAEVSDAGVRNEHMKCVV